MDFFQQLFAIICTGFSLANFLKGYIRKLDY